MSENDTYVLSNAIVKAQEDQSILNSKDQYGNGMSYVAISLFITEIAATDIKTLQNFVYPLVISGAMVCIIYIYCHTLIESINLALITTLLIFMQPDFLFATWRGSHEKFTWMFVLLLLFLLIRSFNIRGRIDLIARYMLIFYFIAFAFIATNVFFASSFTVALVSSLIGGMIVARWIGHKSTASSVQQQARRQLYISVALILLLYLFAFYLYPPALGMFRTLKILGERLSLVLLNVDQHTNAYAYIGATWDSTIIYFLLGLSTWFVLIISVLTWIRGIYVFIFLKKGQLEKQHFPRILLWLLYAGLAIQLALSIVADRANVIGTLQLRLFTPLMLTAVPIAVIGLQASMQHVSLHFKLVAKIFAVAAVMWFSGASLLKVSNEPFLSNKWIFGTKSEEGAGTWAVQAIPKNSYIWVSSDERLMVAIKMDLLSKKI